MAQTIADSFADFSGTQGQNGWYYGLANGGDHMSFVGSSFTQFSTYQPSVMSLGGSYHGVWGPEPGNTWTQLWAEGGHPTGTNYPGTSVAVRRWVSTYEGSVVLDGIFADWHTGSGNGVGGAIYVDDQRVWNGQVGDGGSTSFGLTTLVHQGSKVDFVLGANGNDYTDSTKFSATIAIAPIPEPETYAMMLAGLGLLGFVGRRRKQRSVS
jgi:hypothetical protein